MLHLLSSAFCCFAALTPASHWHHSLNRRTDSPTMGLRQRVRARRELGRLLDGIGSEVRGASTERDLRRLRVRLRRSRRRIDRSIAQISADVESELRAFTTKQPVSLPAALAIDLRQQIAAAIGQDGTIGSIAGLDDAPRPVKEVVPTAASALRLPGRRLTIVTTAALPWMTGTSINPLLRAAHLAARGYTVNLVLPWLSCEQQPTLFPPGITFETAGEQEEWIRSWLHCASFPEEQLARHLRVRWYAGVYEDFLGAVLQRGGVDIIQCIPPEERDVAILEEPEHINWFHHGDRWTSAFRHVIGVLHTNYLYYARYEEREDYPIPGEVREVIMRSFNAIVIKAHVDVSIRLSATLPEVPGRSLVCNVHGVRGDFLAIGASVAALPPEEVRMAFDRGAYFLGKDLWTKGYSELLEQLAAELAAELDAARAASAPASGLSADGAAGGSTGDSVSGSELPVIDTYGSGRDESEIRDAIDAGGLPVCMHPAIDHANPTLRGYRVFVNPSTSEVLCTATAEALAMGKKVLIPRHPSNGFFEQFSNAICFDDRSQLLPLLKEALATPPLPLTPREQYLLSWEAAIERLLDAAALADDGAGVPRDEPLANAAYSFHNALSAPPLDDYFRENAGGSIAGLRASNPRAGDSLLVP